MRLGIFTIAVVSALAATECVSQDYHPTFQPGDYKAPPAAPANEVLVLGTPHLSGLPAQFAPTQLEPVIDRLAGWQPDAIAIEAISGLQCDRMRRQPDRLASALEFYCFDPTVHADALGLDVSEANGEAERILSDWPTDPTPAQRRRLAAVFLAAGEPVSATVQWLRIPETDRREGDGITAEMVAELGRRTTSRNENELIGAALAVRLNLDRVWSVDDQSFDVPTGDLEAYGRALTAAWDNPASAQRRATDARLHAGLEEADGLLNLYRTLNAPEQAELNFRSDWGAALTEPSPEAYGRRYVAYWETRNLRMVANIREVLGRQPGTRLLAIVGASHKAYYEAYLDQMHDVVLTDAGVVLE